MTEREALKLALEVLEYPGPSWIEARQPAIAAIKEVLAQPEQKPEKIPESWATHGGLWIETLYKHQRGEK